MLKKVIVFSIFFIFLSNLYSNQNNLNNLIDGYKKSPEVYQQKLVDYVLSGHLGEFLKESGRNPKLFTLTTEIKEYLISKSIGNPDYKNILKAVNRLDISNKAILDFDKKNLSVSDAIDSAEKANEQNDFGIPQVGKKIFDEEINLFDSFCSPVEYFKLEVSPDDSLISKEDFILDNGSTNELATYENGLSFLFDNKKYINAYKEFNSLKQSQDSSLRECAYFLTGLSAYHFSFDSCETSLNDFYTNFPQSKFIVQYNYLKAINYYGNSEYNNAIKYYEKNLQNSKFGEESLFFKAVSYLLISDGANAYNLFSDYSSKYEKYHEQAGFGKLCTDFSAKQYSACLEHSSFSDFDDPVLKEYKLYIIAFCHLKTGNYTEAIAKLEELEDSEDDFLKNAAYFWDAYAKFKTKKYIDAFDLIDKVTSESLIYPLALYLSGDMNLYISMSFHYGTYYSISYLNKAYKKYKKALPLLNDDLYSWCRLRRAMSKYYFDYWENVDYIKELNELKVNYYNKLIGELSAFYLPLVRLRWTNSYELSDSIADVKYFLNNYKSSIYKPQMKALKALLLLKYGKSSDAENAFMDVIISYPDSRFEFDSRIQLIKIFKQQNDFEKQAINIEAVLKKFDTGNRKLTMMTELADLYKDKLKNPGNAIKWYSIILNDYPNSNEYMHILSARAYCYLETGDTEKAKIDFRVLMDAKYPKELQASAYYGYSRCLMKEKKYSDSIEYLEHLLSFKTYKPDFAVFAIGVCYQKIGNTEKATEYYQKVISEYPDSNYKDLSVQHIECLAIGSVSSLDFLFYDDLEVKLMWQPVSTNTKIVKQYNVYRKKSQDNDFEFLGITNVNPDSLPDNYYIYEDKSLAWENNYQYVVKAVTKFGRETGSSPTVEVRVSKHAPAPHSTLVSNKGFVTLKWNKIKKYRTVKYRAYCRKKGNQEWKLLPQYSDNNSTWNVVYANFAIDNEPKQYDSVYQYKVSSCYEDYEDLDSLDSEILEYRDDYLMPPDTNGIAMSSDEVTIYLSYLSGDFIDHVNLYWLDTSEEQLIPGNEIVYRETTGNGWEFSGNACDPENTIPNSTYITNPWEQSSWYINFRCPHIITKLSADTRFSADNNHDYVTTDWYYYSGFNKNSLIFGQTPEDKYTSDYSALMRLSFVRFYSYYQRKDSSGKIRQTLLHFNAYEPSFRKIDISSWNNTGTGGVLKCIIPDELKDKKFTLTLTDINGNESIKSAPFELEVRK